MIYLTTLLLTITTILFLIKEYFLSIYFESSISINDFFTKLLKGRSKSYVGIFFVPEVHQENKKLISKMVRMVSFFIFTLLLMVLGSVLFVYWIKSL